MATTLSLIAIFVPVGFMGGIVGRFMKSFGLTMSFAILVSLLVSFTLTPMLSARWIKAKKDEDTRSPLEGFPFLPADRPGLRPGAHVGARASRRGRRDGGAGAAEQRAALHGREQELPARTTTSRSSRSVCARRKARASTRPRSSINRIATQVRTIPEIAYTLVTIADDPAQTQNSGTIYVRLKPLNERKRDQFAGDGRGPHRDPPAVRVGQPAHRRPAGRDVRRRRQPERRDPVHDQRARSRQAREVRRAASPTLRASSRASSTWTRR